MEWNRIHRRCLRFSLSTVLFIILVTGGFLAGYRHGFRKGDFDGTSARVGYEFLEDAHFTTTHDITRLIIGNNVAACEFDPAFIIALIEDAVPRDPIRTEIRVDGFDLVVAANGWQHKEIAALVDQLARIDERMLAKLEARTGFAPQQRTAAKPLGGRRLAAERP